MHAAVQAVVDLLLSLARAAARQAEAERDRWVLWTPVAYGCGIATYFAWQHEPGAIDLSCAAAIAVAGFGGMLCLRARCPGIAALGAAVGIMAAGFLASALRTAAVAAPILPAVERARPVGFSGALIGQERLPDGGLRLLLACPQIDGLDPAATPARLRLVLPGKLAPAERLRPGDRIAGLARLAPPPPPVAIGSYDAARALFYQQVGAIGQVTRIPRALPDPGPCADSAMRSTSLVLERARAGVADLVLRTLDGETGSVALAFIIGDQRQIPEPALQAMRDAGLAHLLSISGLHLVLVGGLFLVSIRRGLALWPALALRVPLHKVAAAAAACGTFGYMLLADSPIPTQRAFGAFALMMLAVLCDRHPVSLRLVAWSAFAVLLAQPESILGASFQMSFAAVVALIAAHEAQQRRRSEGIPAAFGRYVAALLLTSMIAGLATGPIGAYHFNRVASYGLIANMVAVPVTGLLVMPGALLGLALWPLGLEHLGLIPMGWGVDLVLGVGRAVTDLPGAVAIVRSFALSGFIAATGGFLWLCLWRTAWRWWGVPVIACGLAFGYGHPPPDLQIAADSRLIAVRDHDGDVVASRGARTGMLAATWARRAGQGSLTTWPRDGFGMPGDAPRLRCDVDGCLYTAAGQTVSLLRRMRGFAEDCRHADAVLLPATARLRRSTRAPSLTGCKPATTLITPAEIRAGEGIAIRLRPSGIDVQTIRSWRGDRPWTRTTRLPRWPAGTRTQPVAPPNDRRPMSPPGDHAEAATNPRSGPLLTD
ncbi:MAG: ComEC/Rec2 family competence protein [Alphaproteobacteria bacterium]|nr:ComEC/Rec2 family competence protein [Alphaproteobacteria bacterium]